LDPKTANKAKINTPKLTYGVLSYGMMGALVNQGKNASIIAIAEGPETALSIREANPHLTIYAVLGSGNLSRVPFTKETKHILFCADNDGKKSASELKLQKAADYYADKNMHVWQTMPEKVKQDFNDILKESGKERVRTYIKNAELIRTPQSIEITKIEATHLMAELVGQPLTQTTTLSLNNLLLSYVDCEMEQTRLVISMHENRIKNPAASKEYGLKAAINHKKKEALGLEVMKHAEAKTHLVNKIDNRANNVQTLGGFGGLQKRFQKGKETFQDIMALVVYIHNKVHSETRSLSKHKGQTR
jgi:hypothetical protein